MSLLHVLREQILRTTWKGTVLTEHNWVLLQVNILIMNGWMLFEVTSNAILIQVLLEDGGQGSNVILSLNFSLRWNLNQKG